MTGKLLPGNTGFHTRNEIFQQPVMWERTYETIISEKGEITSFLEKLPDDIDMILTGAGTSAFIGNAVCGVRTRFHGGSSEAIPTTELITHPGYYLAREKPVVLVSFARSGNSPESLAAFDIVNGYCTKAYHIIITCNEDGALYKKTKSSGVLKILLPPETNDASLAMTSSFSSMMLAFILINRIDTIESEKEKVNKLSGWGNLILTKYNTPVFEISTRNFERAVFLGSGPLRGTAEECHLKLQELTDGAVICTFNSFLGFRHGPRAVVNDSTLLVYLFEDDDNTRKYEYDLVRQINSGNKRLTQIFVSHKPVVIGGVIPDLDICFGKNDDNVAPVEYLCVAEVLVAQLLGFHKSLSLGLDPDNPSESGTISRVVEGVKIYKINFGL